MLLNAENARPLPARRRRAIGKIPTMKRLTPGSNTTRPLVVDGRNQPPARSSRCRPGHRSVSLRIARPTEREGLSDDSDRQFRQRRATEIYVPDMDLSDSGSSALLPG